MTSVPFLAFALIVADGCSSVDGLSMMEDARAIDGGSRDREPPQPGDAGEIHSPDTGTDAPDSGSEMTLVDGGMVDGGIEPPPDAGEPVPDAGPPPIVDRGEGDGSDVVTIGDSYMRLPNLIQQPGNEGVELSLERASGRTYRKYGYTGATLFPPTAVAILNDVIPGQFAAAMNEDPNILTVVANGGGNDLTDDCDGAVTIADLSSTCIALLDQIDDAIETMIAEMAAAGVLDVVWVGYGDTTMSGMRVFSGALDYLRERRIERCVVPAFGIRCHYVDNKARPGLVTRDGFHPDAAGYDLIGQAVWDRMQAEGVRR
jgi:hypothetical protein